MNKAELKIALAEVAKTAGMPTSAQRSAFAELLVEYIQPNHLSLELFNAFMPVKQMKAGDVLVRKVRKGKYPVRSMVPGSMHLTDQVAYQDQQNWVFDRLIAGTKASLWEINQGDVDSVQTMKKELQADITDEIFYRVYGLLSTAWNGADTPTNYIDVSSGGLTVAAVDTMVENILDYSGEVKVIMGTRKALRKLYDAIGYREFILSGTGTDRVGFSTPAFLEYFNTNKVSSYHGIPLLEIPQTFAQRLPDLRKRLVPTDKVIVVGGNAGNIALMDGFQTQEYTDFRTQPAEYIVHGWQAYGLIVDDIQQIGVLNVGSNG